MHKPFSGFIWLICILCLSLIFGLPGCSIQNTNSVSHITFLVKEDSFSRSNIGLLGSAGEGIPKPLTLPADLFLEPDKGIIMQAFQGMWYGAVAGMEAGQVFCGGWGTHTGGGRITITSGDATVALAFLVLCGGGIVGGAGIGAAYGMVSPFLSSPRQKEISIAQERVVQGIWTKLTNQKKYRGTSRHSDVDSQPLVDGGNKTRFGVKGQPFSAFMKIKPLQVGLFTKSKFDSKAFTLLWKIRVIFFDSRKRMVAKQLIEIQQGEYGFDKWAEQDAAFLKTKLEEGYQLAAVQIMRKLSTY